MPPAPGSCHPLPSLGCRAGWSGGPAGRGSQRSRRGRLSNLQLLSFGCHSRMAQVQKCSPGRRAGWPRLPGFPSLSAPIFGCVPFSRPFPSLGAGASVLEVGDGPLLPHVLPPRLGAPGWAWPALPLPSEPRWLASAMFVLARRVACRSQGEDELGTVCLLPPRLRVSPESGHPSGAGGRDRRRLLLAGLLWQGSGRDGTSVHPRRPATVAEPRWRSQCGHGRWCMVLTPRGMQLTGRGSSGTGVSVCVPAWSCGRVGTLLCPPHPSCPHAGSPLPCTEVPEAPHWV